MKGIKLSKDAKLCVLATTIIVIAYAGEKFVEIFSTPSKALALGLAMLYTALLLVITLILMNAKSTFFGLLAALIGYKMMPVPIRFLESQSFDGAMLYFIVEKAAVLIFAFLAFKFYNAQEKPRAIKPLPILAIMLAVPFFNELGMQFTNYFQLKTGSMLYGFMAQFACYIAASALILATGYLSGRESMRFTAYFECFALSVKIAHYLGKIGVRIYHNVHISKSLYIWIAIYVVLIICFLVAKNIKYKKEC